MSGPLPPEWSSLTTLQTLDLNPITGSHGINGTLPGEWSTLVQLQYINIVNAPFLEGVREGGEEGACW